MATATQKARTAKSAARDAADPSIVEADRGLDDPVTT